MNNFHGTNFAAGGTIQKHHSNMPLPTSEGGATFRPINFYCINVGELVRKSKTRTCWHIDLDGQRYSFEIEHSKMLGQKKLLKNNCLIKEEKSLRKLFNYQLTIGDHVLDFTQHADKFDLRVDAQSFMYVYNKLRQQDHFEYERNDGQE